MTFYMCYVVEKLVTQLKNILLCSRVRHVTRVSAYYGCLMFCQLMMSLELFFSNVHS